MREEAPLVSVVIPTYNHAPMLREALASVTAQSYRQWEAIVVNNFSTDDTAAVVASFNDPRITLRNFRNNGIIAASRNEGIRVAAGRYVAFLDSDDTWRPEKLERCIEALQSGADVVCHAELWTYEDGRSKEVQYGPAEKATYEALLYDGNCISTSATMVRTELLRRVGGFSESPELVTAEDYDMWLRLARVTRRIVFLDEILGRYRLHASNASAAVLRNAAAILCVIDSHARARGDGMRERLRLRRRRAAVMAGSGWALSREGNYRDGLRQITRALGLWPLSAKTIGAAAATVGARLLRPAAGRAR